MRTTGLVLLLAAPAAGFLVPAPSSPLRTVPQWKPTTRGVPLQNSPSDKNGNKPGAWLNATPPPAPTPKQQPPEPTRIDRPQQGPQPANRPGAMKSRSGWVQYAVALAVGFGLGPVSKAIRGAIDSRSAPKEPEAITIPTPDPRKSDKKKDDDDEDEKQEGGL